MSPWMKIPGKYLPLRRGDAALPHLCNSISVTITTETAAFPVAITIERQRGEESGPPFQFRGILSFVEEGRKESELGFKCCVLIDIGFISNLTPKILLIL